VQARIYAPTIEQRKEALKVAERPRPKRIVFRLSLYVIFTLACAWYSSDFVLPFEVDKVDLAVGVLAALLGEIGDFFSKKSRAKWHFEDNEELARENGPLQYRLTDTGLDSWWLGERMHLEWAAFARFKLTDDLLILVPSRQRDSYWAIPRNGVDDALLSIVVRKLEEGGATDAAGH